MRESAHKSHAHMFARIGCGLASTGNLSLKKASRGMHQYRTTYRVQRG